ncbi:hypothetical protein [Zobellella maritima]|uniref:hypothetical protein n=1 Tax=Zobellella maritima TaxID=2059725 RepID=UPI000E30157A|nr:hypothetical protein [Zobellella maritima]
MSVLGQILRSLQDSQDGRLDPDKVCVQLVRACRHAEQHLAGLDRQCRQLRQEQASLDGSRNQQHHEIDRLEQAALTALAAAESELARQLAVRVAELEEQLAGTQLAQATIQRQLAYYQGRRLQAERHYHDLCRQLSMAKATSCVQKTMAAIRRNPQVKLLNARQAVRQIRAREQAQEQAAQPAETAAEDTTADVHSADQVLARLQRQLDTRP